MKKTILFFSLILIGAFAMFGFQKSINVNSDNNIKVEAQQPTNDGYVYEINSVTNIKDEAKCGDGKCGEGKCGDGKAAGKKHTFMDIDTNSDGKVSKEEFSAHGIKEFPNKDKNNDGKLSSGECMMFDEFNTDKNDFLSAEEFSKGHDKLFSKLDKNSDGFVDATEAKEVEKMHAEKCGAGKCGGDKKTSKK